MGTLVATSPRLNLEIIREGKKFVKFRLMWTKVDVPARGTHQFIKTITKSLDYMIVVADAGLKATKRSWGFGSSQRKSGTP